MFWNIQKPPMRVGAFISVRVRSIVPAESEASRRSIGGFSRSDRPGILLDVGGIPEATIR